MKEHNRDVGLLVCGIVLSGHQQKRCRLKGTIEEMLSLAKRKQHLLLPDLINSIDNTFTSHGASSEALNRLPMYLPALLDHAEGAQQASVPRLREAGAAASTLRL